MSALRAKELNGTALAQEFIPTLARDMFSLYAEQFTVAQESGFIVHPEGALVRPVAGRFLDSGSLTYQNGVSYDGRIDIAVFTPDSVESIEELTSLGWWEKFFSGAQVSCTPQYVQITQEVANHPVRARVHVEDPTCLTHAERRVISALLIMEPDLMERAFADGVILAEEKPARGIMVMGPAASLITGVFLRKNGELCAYDPEEYLRSLADQSGSRPVVFLRGEEHGEHTR